ncbi:PREDICTED: VITISV_032574, partial [Prunus dulcis]
TQGARVRERLRDERNDRSSLTRSRTNLRQQLVEESSQAQSTNLPHGQGNRGGQLLQVDEEVNHPRLNHEGRQHDRQAMRAEDVEKLVNDRLRNLKIGGNFEHALRREVDQANSTPFTAEIEQTAPPKRFSTPSFTHFKGDSDPDSNLKHFKSIMIFYKANDALMCKVFAMTLLGAAQDWFYTLPSGSISSFKELAYVFTKEYTSYRMIKKNPDHLFNLQKKYEESLRDYIKRFKAERANIIGCDDRIASSAFKRGLPIECELYRELTISPCQTLVEVFATAERYALWDDDRIAAKKAAKQADQPVEAASQRNDMIKDKDGGKRELQPQGGAPTTETYTKFTIPIQQTLAQKKHLEELVRDGHCTKFIS